MNDDEGFGTNSDTYSAMNDDGSGTIFSPFILIQLIDSVYFHPIFLIYLMFLLEFDKSIVIVLFDFRL